VRRLPSAATILQVLESALGQTDGAQLRLRNTHFFAIVMYVRTNIDLDAGLVTRGLRLSGLRTKKDFVNMALQEFVRRKDQKQILELRGNIRWAGDLDLMRQSRF